MEKFNNNVAKVFRPLRSFPLNHKVEVLSFSRRSNPLYGEGISIELEDAYTYLPKRFLEELSDADIESLNQLPKKFIIVTEILSRTVNVSVVTE